MHFRRWPLGVAVSSSAVERIRTITKARSCLLPYGLLSMVAIALRGNYAWVRMAHFHWGGNATNSLNLSSLNANGVWQLRRCCSIRRPATEGSWPVNIVTSDCWRFTASAKHHSFLPALVSFQNANQGRQNRWAVLTERLADTSSSWMAALLPLGSARSRLASNRLLPNATRQP